MIKPVGTLTTFITNTLTAGKDTIRAIAIGTNFPQSQPLMKDCHFGVSQVNYSDSEDPVRTESVRGVLMARP